MNLIFAPLARLGTWLPLLIAGAASVLPAARAQANRPPNVILIFCDDLGYGDISAFGQTKFQTPNIDKLASGGMKVMTHYAGNAVCAASRCSLLSSLHPGHTYIRGNLHPADYAPGIHEGQEPVPPGELHFPLTMQKLGWETGGFGKWSEGSIASTGSALKQGFDHWYGYACQSQAHSYYPKYLWDDGKQVFLDNVWPQGKLRKGGNPAIPNNWRYDLAPGADPKDPNSYKAFTGKQYSSDLINAKAREFIRTYQDRPFFVYLASTIPHINLQVPDDSLQQFLGKFGDDQPAAAGMVGGGDAPPVFAPRAAYAAMITRFDRDVGRMVAEVHDLGLDENTIFIFTSDNGAPPEEVCQYFHSGGPFRGYKSMMYEGGSREPCFVTWKGKIAPGTSTDRVTGDEDWLPTLLELSGMAKDIPQGIDGVSFAPTLLGQAQPSRPYLYREMPDMLGEQFVREGKWKAVRQWFKGGGSPLEKDFLPRGWGRYPGIIAPDIHSRSGVVELYDLEADPGEQHNLASEHPGIVAHLTALLTEAHKPTELFPLIGLGEKGREQNTADLAKAEAASPIDFRALLSEPPAAPSTAARNEINTVLALQETRSAADAQAFRADTRASAFAFSRILGPTFNPADLPNTADWLKSISSYTTQMAAQAASLWHRPAPEQVDRRVHPVLSNGQEGSYPSLRAVQGVVWATILSQIYPERRQDLMEFGRELGQDSVAAGANYSSDVAAGQKLGGEIARRLLADPAFQAQLNRAKDECLD